MHFLDVETLDPRVGGGSGAVDGPLEGADEEELPRTGDERGFAHRRLGGFLEKGAGRGGRSAELRVPRRHDQSNGDGGGNKDTCGRDASVAVPMAPGIVTMSRSRAGGWVGGHYLVDRDGIGAGVDELADLLTELKHGRVPPSSF